MLTNRPKTKILVDGGDPNETLRIKSLLGFVDGQTTNPSLIAKNPEIQQLIASGHTLSPEEEKNEYKKIVQSISPLVGDAGVSIEVFADLNTTTEEMLAQGDRKSTRLNSSHLVISYAVFCLKKKKNINPYNVKILQTAQNPLITPTRVPLNIHSAGHKLCIPNTCLYKLYAYSRLVHCNRTST